ncbi:thioredoxin family protein [Thalassorhabdus alkalitolerans]|uniref:Thioredoxin family protein n=1 Tax=Thalassorhabdus alkalitolerans TaxID=2282697 RepID=A0ABW0YMF3_9BACI|nr:thioredoxin family protein [Thalassobacillus sp. C254]
MQEITSAEELENVLDDNMQRAFLLLIKAPRCTVCEAVEQQLTSFMNAYSSVIVNKISLEKVPSVSGKFLVFAAPTILIFKGGKEVWRGSRFISYDEMERVFRNM